MTKLTKEAGKDSVLRCDFEDINENHDLLWKSLDLLDGFFLFINKDGIILDASQGGERLLSKTHDEIVGKNWFDTFIPERLRERMKTFHGEVMSGKEGASEHYNPVLDAGGNEIEVHWHNAIVLKDSKPFGVLSNGYSSDYTDKLRDATLKTHILDSSKDTFLLADLSGKIIYANQVVKEVGGWDLDKLKGQSVFRTILEDDEDVVSALQGSIKEGKSITMQLNLNRADSSMYPAEITVRPVSFEMETYMAIVSRDLRQIIAAQEALVASERRYKAYVENTEDVIFTLDEEHKINYISPQIEKYSFSVRELIGKRFFDLVYEDDQDQVEKRIGRRHAPVTFRLKKDKDEEFWFEASIRPQLGDSGKPVGFVGSMHDVTWRIETEREREKLLDSERQISEIGGELLASDANQLGKVLQAALERICKITGALSGAITVVTPAGELAHSYIWEKEGIERRDIDLGFLSRAPNLLRKMATGEVFAANPTETAEPGVRGELEIAGFRPNECLILAPFIIGERAGGAVSLYSNTEKGKVFTDSDISIVKLFSGLAGSAVVNRQNNERLEQEAEWEKAISNFSASFISGSKSGETFGELFKNGFSGIAKMMGADRAALYENNEINIRHVGGWSREGLSVEPLIEVMDTEKINLIVESVKDELVVVNKVSDLPGSAQKQLRESGGSPRLKSFMAARLSSGEVLVGVLLILSYDSEVSWSETSKSRLRTAADILTSVILRKQASSNLDKRLSIEMAVSEAVADLATVRVDSIQFKAARAMSKLAASLKADGAGFFYLSSSRELIPYATWQNETASAIFDFHSVKGLSEGTASLMRLEKGEILRITSRQDALSLMGDEFVTNLDPHLGFICLPTQREGKLVSIFCLSAPRETVVTWSNEDTLPLRTFSDALFSSFARIKSDEKMKELERLRVRFIHVVSHQLRTPLNSIRWSLEALLGGELGDLRNEQRDFVKVVYDAELKIISRIRDMIIALDIEEGRVSLSREEGVMEALWGSVMSSSQAKFDKAGINFKYEPPSEQLPAVFVDSEKIRFAMESLVNNAISYTRPGGNVKVSLRREDDKIRFEIRDDGVGIPEIEQPEIFNRFFRASNASVMVQDASGLSLSIAKYYVDRHGGEIGFASKPDKGSTFWFTLPI